MYQVVAKGRTLEELKKSVSDIHQELQTGVVVNGMVKNLDTSLKEELIKSTPEVTPVAEPVIAQPAQALSAPSVGVEKDGEGLPWDKRIHSSSRKFIKDGTWRLKKGVDKDLVEQVKSELRQAVHQASNPTPTPAVPVSGSTPVVNSPLAGSESPAPAQTQQPVAAPVAPVTPVNPAPVVEQAPVAAPTPPQNPPLTQGGHTFDSFKQNMPMVITDLINQGKINQDYVNQLKSHFGVTEIWNVSDEQKLEMFNAFVQYNFIQKVG